MAEDIKISVDGQEIPAQPGQWSSRRQWKPDCTYPISATTLA